MNWKETGHQTNLLLSTVASETHARQSQNPTGSRASSGGKWKQCEEACLIENLQIPTGQHPSDLLHSYVVMH